MLIETVHTVHTSLCEDPKTEVMIHILQQQHSDHGGPMLHQTSYEAYQQILLISPIS